MSRLRVPPAIPLGLTLLVGGACATPYDRPFVGKELERRIGHAISPQRRPGPVEVPRGVRLDDGVTEDEAVALALWNNPQLQVDMTQLGFARADLVEAGLIANPILSLLFPVGPKPFELSIFQAFENLWQLPSRLRAARREIARVAFDLVQLGLELSRDARLAHAEVVLAEARARITTSALGMWRASEALFAARARAGDVSELEVQAIAGDVLAARDAEARARQALVIARQRLRFLVGMTEDARGFGVVAGPIAGDAQVPPVATLSEAALAARPDLQAAQFAVEAAGARVGWEQAKVFALSGAFNVKGVGTLSGQQVLASGPGLQAALPLFNQNQGGIGRARSDVERAIRRLATLRQRVLLDVQEASAQLVQAHELLRAWRAELVPARVAALSLARMTHEAGNESYLVVLDAQRQLDLARIREAELEADVRRAAAQLDRSVGGRAR